MHFANLPFPVGSTAGITSASDGTDIEGREYYVGDFDYSGAVEILRSNRVRKLRVVRNAVTIGSGGDVTTGNLRPKRLVTFKSGTYRAQVDGYARTTAVGGAVPVDEWLPAAGVAPNDLFYVVIEGPAVVLTDIAAAAGNLISVGDNIVSLTAATSGATTAGRVATADFTGATALLAAQITNTIGRALSAATTNSTNSSLLIDVARSIL